MTVFLTKHPWAAGSGLLSLLLGTLLVTAPALLSSSASGSPPGASDVPCSQVSSNTASLSGESVEAAESDALPVSTVKVWATVYDQATIDAWNASGYIPAFLDGVQVDDVPLDQAVCDLDVIAPDASGEWYHLKMRVRSSDGAIAAVFMEPVIVPADPIPVDYPTGEPSRGCNGGPWWRRGRVCCFAQYLICSTVHRLFPHYCSQCAECFRDCMNCSVNNPCHSCGDCGGSQILCYFFGHC